MGRSGRLWKKGTVNSVLLHGEYELTLDDKNRLLIPAEIRRRLNPTDDRNVFFIKLGINGVPWVYPASKWLEMASEGDSGMDPGAERLDHDHFHYGMTYELEWDKQGPCGDPGSNASQDRYWQGSHAGWDQGSLGIVEQGGMGRAHGCASCHVCPAREDASDARASGICVESVGYGTHRGASGARMQHWRATMDRPWVIADMEVGNPRFPVFHGATAAEPDRASEDDSLSVDAVRQSHGRGPHPGR